MVSLPHCEYAGSQFISKYWMYFTVVSRVAWLHRELCLSSFFTFLLGKKARGGCLFKIKANSLSFFPYKITPICLKRPCFIKTGIASFGRMKCKEDRSNLFPAFPVFNFRVAITCPSVARDAILMLSLGRSCVESDTILPGLGVLSRRLKDGAVLSIPFCSNEIQTQAACVDFSSYQPCPSVMWDAQSPRQSCVFGGKHLSWTRCMEEPIQGCSIALKTSW